MGDPRSEGRGHREVLSSQKIKKHHHKLSKVWISVQIQDSLLTSFRPTSCETGSKSSNRSSLYQKPRKGRPTNCPKSRISIQIPDSLGHVLGRVIRNRQENRHL